MTSTTICWKKIYQNNEWIVFVALGYKHFIQVLGDHILQTVWQWVSVQLESRSSLVT